MRLAAVPDRAVVERAGLLLRQRDQRRDVVHRQRRAHHQDVGDAGDHGDECEVADAVIADLGRERRRDDVRGRGREQQCVAIRRRARDMLGRDRGGGAGLVQDDDLLPEAVPHGRGERAGQHVGRSAGRVRVDQHDRARWIGLRMRAAWRWPGRQSSARAIAHACANTFHRSSPHTRRARHRWFGMVARRSFKRHLRAAAHRIFHEAALVPAFAVRAQGDDRRARARPRPTASTACARWWRPPGRTFR